jgi:pyrimidine deaminase RibD-like protein
VILLLAGAFLVSLVAAEDALMGEGADILGTGIFETNGNAFKFPVAADTNYDSVSVGNDRALALGMGDGFPFTFSNGPASAQNNLEIKKNQDSGTCEPCSGIDNASPCTDYCLKVNLERISAGSREALAIGFATARNNVKIVTNQQ